MQLTSNLIHAINNKRQHLKYTKVINNQQILLPPPIITSSSHPQPLPSVSSAKVIIQPYINRFKSKSQSNLKSNILPSNLLNIQQSNITHLKSNRPHSHSKPNLHQQTPIKNNLFTNIKLTLPTTINHPKNNKGKTIMYDQIIKQYNQEILLTVKLYTIQENPAYKSFISSLKSDNDNLFRVIQGLKKFINKYKIQNGTIQTKNIPNLLKRKSISNYQYLNLFLNKNNIVKNKKIIGIQYYDGYKGKNLAATKIQSFFRMIMDQKYVIKLKSLLKKVKFIQNCWKTAFLMKKTRKNILHTINLRIDKFKHLSTKLQQNWQIIKSSPRVQVHLGSYSIQEFKRLTTQHFYQHQNTQINRIFRAAQTDVSIIYISPLPLSDKILEYYERIFQTNNLTMKCKVFIVVPQNISRLPSSLSVVSQLLYSPKALKKIKSILEGVKQYSYIVPSFPSTQYINLSVQLNIPVLSSNPHLHKLYSNKSSFRLIMQNAKIPVLKNVHSIYSEKQLINSLSILIYKYSQVKRWYLKIQNEFHSRGLAIINTESFVFIRQLRKEKEIIGVTQSQIIKMIAQEITNKIKSKIKIIQKSVYKSYQEFMAHFCTRGGLIEAQLPQKFYQHSISIFIEPNGEFKVIGTYNKLQLASKTVSAIKFPAQHPVPQSIDITHKIVRQLYKSLYFHYKLYGYFTIDLLSNLLTNQVYAIGLDCFLNQSTSSMFFAYTITQSCYQKDQNQIKKYIKGNNQNLDFIYCPLIGINNMPYFSDFFKNAKFGNISFDLKQKIGTLFILVDELQCSQIGILWIQSNFQNLLQLVLKSCKYLSQSYNVNQQVRFLKSISLVLSRKNKKKQSSQMEINLDDIF